MLNDLNRLEIESLGFISSTVFQGSEYNPPVLEVVFLYEEARDHNFQSYILFKAFIVGEAGAKDSIAWDSRMTSYSITKLCRFKDDAENKLIKAIK
jgi:hypothetical protein